MRSVIYIVYCGVLAAVLHLRAFVPGSLALPVYLILVLVPQLIFLFFDVREVAESIRAYREAACEGNVFALHNDSRRRVRTREGSCMKILLIRARIHPVRAGPMCGFRQNICF